MSINLLIRCSIVAAELLAAFDREGFRPLFVDQHSDGDGGLIGQTPGPGVLTAALMVMVTTTLATIRRGMSVNCKDKQEVQ